MKSKSKNKTRNNHFLCLMCPKEHNEIQGVGQVVKGKIYCLRHAKQLLGLPAGISGAKAD